MADLAREAAIREEMELEAELADIIAQEDRRTPAARPRPTSFRPIRPTPAVEEVSPVSVSSGLAATIRSMPPGETIVPRAAYPTGARPRAPINPQWSDPSEVAARQRRSDAIAEVARRAAYKTQARRAHQREMARRVSTTLIFP